MMGADDLGDLSVYRTRGGSLITVAAGVGPQTKGHGLNGAVGSSVLIFSSSAPGRLHFRSSTTGGQDVSDADTAPKKFMARVEDEVRADVTADGKLAVELIAELVSKVEALEKRIVKLERGS
jgi:hypothetical protein